MRSKDKKRSWRVSLGVYLFIPRFHSHLFWASQQTQRPQNISRGFQNQVTLDATPRKGYTRLYEHPASAPGPGPGEALLGQRTGQVLQCQAAVSLVTQGLLCNGLQGPSQLNCVWRQGFILQKSGVKVSSRDTNAVSLEHYQPGLAVHPQTQATHPSAKRRHS